MVKVVGLLPVQSLVYHLCSCEFAPRFGNTKKGALDLQSYVIRFVSYVPKVGGFLRVLRFPPPVKLTAMI